MFGMSFTYALFGEGTDIYWARTRVLEQLGRVQQLCHQAYLRRSGPMRVAWAGLSIRAEGQHRRMDLAELRVAGFHGPPALQAVAGVAEVASLGGFERQIPRSSSIRIGWLASPTVTDITRSVRDANAEVGARVLELAGREYVLRARLRQGTEGSRQSVVAVGAGGTPIRLGDVATSLRAEIRRGRGLQRHGRRSAGSW